MQVTMQSVATGKTHTREIDVDPAALKAWRQAGANAPHIQHAFPDLSADDREFLLTGTTPEEWDEMFGEEK